MIKFLPVLVICGMVGFLLYVRFFKTSSPASPQPLAQSETPALFPQPAKGDASLTERIRVLEEAITTLAKQVNNLKSSADLSKGDLEARVKSLEGVVSTLQKTSQTVVPPPTPAASTSKKSSVYIPLGSSGSGNDKSYLGLEAFTITLDPADFEGYSTMQLEANLKLAQLIGTVYARLYNETDKGAVSSSEVSSTSDKFVLVSSSGFRLASGRKTYRLQLQSSQGTEAFVQNARIKVNF